MPNRITTSTSWPMTKKSFALLSLSRLQFSVALLFFRVIRRRPRSARFCVSFSISIRLLIFFLATIIHTCTFYASDLCDLPWSSEQNTFFGTEWTNQSQIDTAIESAAAAAAQFIESKCVFFFRRLRVYVCFLIYVFHEIIFEYIQNSAMPCCLFLSFVANDVHSQLHITRRRRKKKNNKQQQKHIRALDYMQTTYGERNSFSLMHCAREWMCVWMNNDKQIETRNDIQTAHGWRQNNGGEQRNEARAQQQNTIIALSTIFGNDKIVRTELVAERVCMCVCVWVWRIDECYKINRIVLCIFMYGFVIATHNSQLTAMRAHILPKTAKCLSRIKAK